LALSLLVHLNISGSSLTIPPDDWRQTLDVHLHERPFYMRPLQSYSTLVLAGVTGLTARDAFFVIQYLLMGLTAYLFFRLLLMLGFNRPWAQVGIVFLMLSLPVIAAFFAPIHTWDDFWLYLFLIALSIALLKHRWPWVSVLFFLSCLARETAVFFFPVLVFMAWRDRRRTHPAMLTACLALPLLAFVAYTAMFPDSYRADPIGLLKFSFGSAESAADSIVSLINAFGWCLPAALVGWLLLFKRNRTDEQTYLFAGFILYWPINTAAATTLAMVRETRLLFPPFLFVIPLALYAVRVIWQSGLNRFGWKRLAAVSLLVVGLGAAGIWLGYDLHPTFAYGASSVLRRDYAGLSVGLTAAFLLYKKSRPGDRSGLNNHVIGRI
jgi:hypothetical protein